MTVLIQEEIAFNLQREDGKPMLVMTITDDKWEPMLEVKQSIEEFLEHTECAYCAFEHEGWGEEMITDLEILKAAIEQRIESLRKAIEDEAK